ncbi:MAG: hypothetical protein H0U71_02275 [Gammaproteobacteria bacterium]|nr:hypothetical protein [Gammaproteobacteria bacterium]
MQAGREQINNKEQNLAPRSIPKPIKKNECIVWNPSNDWVTEVGLQLDVYLALKSKDRKISDSHVKYAQSMKKLVDAILKFREQAAAGVNAELNHTAEDQHKNVLLSNLKKPKQLKKWYHREKSYLYTLCKFAYRQHDNYVALANNKERTSKLQEELQSKDTKIAELEYSLKINLERLKSALEENQQLVKENKSVKQQAEEKVLEKGLKESLMGQVSGLSKETEELKTKLETVESNFEKLTNILKRVLASNLSKKISALFTPDETASLEKLSITQTAGERIAAKAQEDNNHTDDNTSQPTSFKFFGKKSKEATKDPADSAFKDAVGNTLERAAVIKEDMKGGLTQVKEKFDNLTLPTFNNPFSRNK